MAMNLTFINSALRYYSNSLGENRYSLEDSKAKQIIQSCIYGKWENRDYEHGQSDSKVI